MAEAEEPVKSLRTSLSCSICWEIFTDPLATPCGHSYCQKCIHEYWDRQELKLEPINCPICRKEFPKRPEPQKNVSLCKAVEDLKAHEKKRRLVTPENTDTREKGTRTTCQRHSRDLTLYCRTERRCICGKCCLTCCLNHDKEDIEDECQQQKNALLTDLQSSDHQKVNTENQIEKWDCKTKEIKALMTMLAVAIAMPVPVTLQSSGSGEIHAPIQSRPAGDPADHEGEAVPSPGG